MEHVKSFKFQGGSQEMAVMDDVLLLKNQAPQQLLSTQSCKPEHAWHFRDISNLVIEIKKYFVIHQLFWLNMHNLLILRKRLLAHEDGQTHRHAANTLTYDFGQTNLNKPGARSHS